MECVCERVERHHVIAFREADGGRPIPASREAGVEWEVMCVREKWARGGEGWMGEDGRGIHSLI